MSNTISDFTRRLYSEWLPDFCYAPHRNYSTEGFNAQSILKLKSFDASWFLNAINEGLVEQDNGFFEAPLSQAKEQIFWTGSKSKVPRPLTLWVEPIITIGAIARLHKEYSWPIENLGMQSKTWAFDLVGYGDKPNEELLVCEVKKDFKEIETLLYFMQLYCSQNPLEVEPTDSKEKNAYRKVQGIRRTWPSLFWALGPGGKSEVFEISRVENSICFKLNKIDENRLEYKKA